jgi:predicted P-loop ATPase
MSSPIDFVRLARALLERSEHFVPQWLRNGFQRGHYWYVGDFDGAEGESANVNLQTGTWIDNGGSEDDRGGDLISLYARIHGLNNGQAARELMEQLGWERQRQDTPRRGPAPQGANKGSADKPGPGEPEAASDGGSADARTEGPADAPQPRQAARRSMWRAVVPVPPHAPKPGFQFKFHDRKMDVWQELDAVRTWEYRFEGDLYGYVARFERVNSKGETVKDTLPRTWCVDESDSRGTHRWHWKTWDAPRPLFVPLGQLSHDCSLPVVVVEGEKCAEAGMQLLGHEFDFVSWPGGCKAWSFARWGWLMGRKVILWPDADSQRKGLTKAEREAGVDPASKPYKPYEMQPGYQAMLHIGQVLVADHACDVFMCRVPEPGKLNDGWDIADAIEQGWDAERVRKFILGAPAFVPPSDEARAKASKPQPSAGAGEGEEVISWRIKLLDALNGSIKPVRENVVLALDGADGGEGKPRIPGIPECDGLLAFNEFTNDVVKTRDTPWGSKAGVWDETDELELGDWLSRAHWLPPMSRQTLEEAVSMVARRHRHHPAREYFESLRGTWDGEKRLGTWLARCCRAEGVGAPDDPLQAYLARVGTWVLMAIVARVLRPGCKFDYMLILEGGQGMGKSTLSRTLAVDWFADTGLVLGDKDSYQNLQGVLVYEWGELDSLTRAEVTKVKQFISSQKDRFRASFDRRPKDYPRQVVFIGTTNESHYLSDPTGNRRFWPVRVTRQIDLDWLRANLQQMFAEALTYLDAGERYHPTQREESTLFQPQQVERTVENALESAIRKLLYDEDQKAGATGRNWSLVDECTLAELLTALGISVDKQTQVLTKQASAALGRLGWERGRSSRPAGDVMRPWVYRRPPKTYAAPAPQSPPAGLGASPSSTGPTQGHSTTETDDVCPF